MKNCALQEWAQSLTYISVIALIAQNTALVILGRYVRTRAGDMFFISVTVVLSEFAKLVACLCMVTYQSGSFAVAAYTCIVTCLHSRSIT